MGPTAPLATPPVEVLVVVDGEAVLLISSLVVEAWRVLDTPILTGRSGVLAGHPHVLVSGRRRDDVGPAVAKVGVGGKGSVVSLVGGVAEVPAEAEFLPPGTARRGGGRSGRGRAGAPVERHGKYLHVGW